MKRLVMHIYIMFMALTAMACQNNEVEATPSDKSVSTMNITINGKTVSCQFIDRCRSNRHHRHLRLGRNRSECSSTRSSHQGNCGNNHV